ncbi:F0F1 ATP synthase subunit A [Jannaschia faecimaris]|uniref:F0F1 ATP synthase subunit A n=1 Tax=Jannaschia faecimaris TaxID=1244108 RepID=UPI001FCDDE0F|nr:F0F1 ATP synthase subunit A [Jannaschia faecimaris]
MFIATANNLSVVPWYQSPTGSLSTTAALAICVLIAVPLFSISRRAIGAYLKTYIQPSPFMLPFNIISEMSRTVSLALRLYGNVMSGAVIAGILISVPPLLFPGSHAASGPAYRCHPSLHLRHPGNGLHRFRQSLGPRSRDKRQ